MMRWLHDSFLARHIARQSSHFEIQMMVLRAPQVEVCRASGAHRIGIEVFGDAQKSAAGAAQHRFRLAASKRPHLGGMVGDRLVAVETRHPQPAAFHAQRDDIVRPSPMRAASIVIDINPVDGYAVDAPHIHAGGPWVRYAD